MVNVRGGWWRILFVLSLAACARRAPPLAGPSNAPVLVTPTRVTLRTAPGDAEWKALGDEATALLSQYVRINTTNPPGNEIAAARWIAEVLRRDGIEARIFEPAPGKANLYARLPGDGGRGDRRRGGSGMDQRAAAGSGAGRRVSVDRRRLDAGRCTRRRRVLWGGYDREVPFLAGRQRAGDGRPRLAADTGQPRPPPDPRAQSHRRLANATDRHAARRALIPRSGDDRARFHGPPLAQRHPYRAARFRRGPGDHRGSHLQRVAAQYGLHYRLEGQRQDERDSADCDGGDRRQTVAGSGPGGVSRGVDAGSRRQRRDVPAAEPDLAGDGKLNGHRAVPRDYRGRARAPSQRPRHDHDAARIHRQPLLSAPRHRELRGGAVSADAGRLTRRARQRRARQRRGAAVRRAVLLRHRRARRRKIGRQAPPTSGERQT